MNPGRLLRVVAPLFVALQVLVALPFVARTPVLAATPDLTLVTSARYVVQPEHARVRVVVDIVATNHKSETVTRRYFFQDAYLAVLPGTSAFTVTAPGAKPTVSVKTRTKDYTLLAIAFGKRVYSGSSLNLRLAFDLKDPGGSPTRDVRVGTTLVTFPVWAFATNSTSGSTVSVTFPAGYVPQLELGQFPPPTTASGGQITYRTQPLADPLSFSAYFVAERPAAYVETTSSATVGQSQIALTLRAWPEDAAWARRTGSLFATSLGQLSTAIGLPIPTAHLTVEEAASRTIGGYAGLFDPALATVRVAYSAGPFVALHEAAHAWFNGRFLADRWANEAFASYYASQVAALVGVPQATDPLTPALEQSRIPLNAWGAVGQSSPVIDDYAYAASYELANSIASVAGGAQGLQPVWAAIAAHEAAYQPIHAGAPPELASAPPDWRSLLDLLEERTGRSFDDLWRTWVVRPEDAALLDERAAARADYLALVAAAGDWELPAAIRTALDGWRFEDARTLIATAQTVLAARPSLEQEATAAGVRLPDRLRTAFEGTAGPSGAAVELNIEHEVIAYIAAAGSAAAAPRDTLAAVGLMGTDPGALLADARAAFGAGNLDLASRDAAAVSDIYGSAEQTGRSRAISALAALASASFLVAALARQLRRRRRPHAHRVAGGPSGSAEPYATLASGPKGTTGRGGPSGAGTAAVPAVSVSPESVPPGSSPPDAVPRGSEPAGTPEAGAAEADDAPVPRRRPKRWPKAIRPKRPGSK